MRLAALGVIGALLKGADNEEATCFLLQTETLPLCLHIMEKGTELEQVVAMFILT